MHLMKEKGVNELRERESILFYTILMQNGWE